MNTAVIRNDLIYEYYGISVDTIFNSIYVYKDFVCIFI